jgi:hypothetical protein
MDWTTHTHMLCGAERRIFECVNLMVCIVTTRLLEELVIGTLYMNGQMRQCVEDKWDTFVKPSWVRMNSC